MQVRRLEGAELDKTRRAMSMINRFAGSAPYARVHELMEALEKELTAVGEHPPPPATVHAIVRLAGSVCTALIRLPRELAERLEGVFGQDSAQVQRYRAAVEQEEKAEAWRLVAGISLALQEHGADIEPIGLEQRATLLLSGEAVKTAESEAEVADVEQPLPVYGVLLAATLIGQRLLAHQLIAAENELRDQLVHLRQLAAEVLEGWPILLEHPLDEQGHFSFEVDDADDEAKLTITPEPLPLDRAEPLVRAFNAARELLARPTSGTQKQPAQDTETSAAEGPDDAIETDEAAKAKPDQSQDQPVRDAQRRDEVTVDLRATVDHVVKLSDQLEEAWSEALDSEQLEEPLQRMRAEWESLLGVLQRRAEAASRELREAGLDPALARHPFDPNLLEELQLQPRETERWRGLHVAEVLLLTQLIEAMQALLAPSKARIQIDESGEGSEQSFWEAGAFSLARSRALVFLRVARETEQAEAHAMSSAGGKSAAPPAPPDWFDRLLLARSAVNQGDVEGAVLHLRLALPERVAELTDTAVADLPDDLEPRLAEHAANAEAAAAIRLLGEAADSLASGVSVDLGVVVPLALLGYNLIGEFCMQLTAEVAQAAVEADTGG